jgi:NAD(P)-dependent dehydrogenase (short-subunit alcohol dehydrogenase family)
MKLTIFGATSASGKLLVEKALAKGYQVTAFVRDEARLGITHSNLMLIRGDALKAADVESAIQGSDAVLSMLGPKGKPAVMAAQSTKHIVDAMEKHHVRRLVVVSVAGIAVPQDNRGRNLIGGLIKLLLKDVFTDRENQLAVLEASGLEWVAVRVPRLTNDPATGSVKAFFGSPSPSLKLTRSDLADFMLEQVTNDQWLGQAPILAN